MRATVLRMRREEAENFIAKVDFGKMGGLVPAVVQDEASGEVLMQAFMNEEALRLTLTTGKMHFWSRTKGRIWLKGEESGHHSIVQNVVLDCDGDALLFKVHQVGPCCHTGKRTCFHNPILPEEAEKLDGRFLDKIYEVVLDRVENPREGSYVSKLSAKGEDAILQKVGEEAFELVLASKKGDEGETVFEASDLVFHLLVLLANKGIPLRKVFEELRRRHAAKTKRAS